MTPPRCRSAGCGRFVAAGMDHCPRHGPSGAGDGGPVLGPELEALRYVLDRLVKEMTDLEQLARHVPRVSSVSVQAERTRHQIGGRDEDTIRAALRSVLADLDDAGGGSA